MAMPRLFSAEEKLLILEEADQCKYGEIGALVGRERIRTLYSSSLHHLCVNARFPGAARSALWATEGTWSTRDGRRSGPLGGVEDQARDAGELAGASSGGYCLTSMLALLGGFATILQADPI